MIYIIHQVQVQGKKDLMNKILIITFILIVGCSSTSRKLETHPTNNYNIFEKFGEVLSNSSFDKTKGMFKKVY